MKELFFHILRYLRPIIKEISPYTEAEPSLVVRYVLFFVFLEIFPLSLLFPLPKK